MGNKIRCMIRLDDITPDMNWERFDRAKEIFHKYEILPLIGVVPDNKDATLHREENREDFWGRIRSLQESGWAVAQHGTYHCYETKDAGILGINPFSEFAGLSYEEQLGKLQTGKSILENHGIFTDIFMAPGHTYDRNTLNALYECGFRVVTDGLYHRPYYAEKIMCVPCRLRGFKKPKGIDTVCLHTNQMSEKDMGELEEFCKKNQDVIVPFTPIDLEAEAVKRNVLVIMYEKCMLWIRKRKNTISNSKRLLWYLQKTNHTSSRVKWLKRAVCLPMLLFYSKEK